MPDPPGPLVDLVLFDRDGTLVHDVPYNGDPALVRPVPGAAEAVDLARRHAKVGIVSNQSGVADGRLTATQVRAVNRRVEELLGPFDVVRWCPHARSGGCSCRKPAPGMVLAAARHVGVLPGRVAVVGDILADVQAARAAGGIGILVPNARTLSVEVAAADLVASDLGAAVRHLVEPLRA
ncbi:D-glycero-alpha-D-manno-heptose-1,7-bisphosphate 7-phosphatase [Dermatobacter hominis]|uniref:D-glycero-alpha-D-manno-heptose-1,7-bisphosphate 7-phosphatase n=1 Tax=Dermatobacter hominis TaxID=2884263 RepID=UPI001D1010B5|nr:HAD-IIIA family hydrolase [Dermatobacter hominis]UDY37493.1 HAD-IIIA family hydrolase [Dermatobacter hominis]